MNRLSKLTPDLRVLSQYLKPDLDTSTGRRQLNIAGDVLSMLVGLPFAVGGLIWLARQTDLQVYRQNSLLILITLGFLVLFNRLGYFLIVELRPDRYGSADSSLISMGQWALLFIYGPSVLWLSVGVSVFYWLRGLYRALTPAQRWVTWRSFVLGLGRDTLAYLLGWQTYLSLGGQIPLAEFTPHMLLVALIALGVDLLATLLLFAPYTLYIIRANYLLTHGWDANRILKFLLMVLGLPALAHPFAILAAGLYVQWGLYAYLFIMVGILLVAYLARRLSWAAEYSRYQSRQLVKLEQLGRAILSAPPDGSTLEEILEEHVVNMFPTRLVLIWVEPQRILLHHPGDWQAPLEALHQWVTRQTQAQVFLAGEIPPWGFPMGDPGPILVAPIREIESTAPLGGICIQLKDLDGPWDRRALSGFFPALLSLCDQVASALHQVQAYNSMLEYQKVVQELNFAGQIQASFLPDEIPELDGFEIAFTIVPARETSGDFFDFIPLSDGRLGFMIADVADKGVGAALYMALCRTLIRTYALEYEENPGVIFFSANNRILQDARANLFVTAFYGVLDTETGTLTYCNAGHNPPYLINTADGREPRLLSATGMPIGVDEDNVWREMTVSMAPGDVLVLYTDGVPDAQDITGERFLDDRLLEVVKAYHDETAQGLMATILEEVQSFVGTAPQFDDITLLILKRD